MCLSTKDATSTDGCNSGLHAGKRSEGKVSLPLCSLTIWYYRYALTLHIAKPDPAFSWHSELNTSLGTTTRNHGSEPTKSIRRQHCKHSEAGNYWHSEAQLGSCKNHGTCQRFGCFKYRSSCEEYTRNAIQHVWQW